MPHVNSYKKSNWTLVLGTHKTDKTKTLSTRIQIHCLFIPRRKNNNAPKFIVSLKQNNWEASFYTINLCFPEK